MTKNEKIAYNMFRARVSSAISSLKWYADDFDCKGLKPTIEGLEEALKEVRKVLK